MDRVHLMAIRAQRFAEAVALRLDAEYPPALLVEHTLLDQFIDRLAGFERRVDLDQGLGPEQSLRERVLDLLADPPITNVDEGLDVRAVGLNQAVAEPKDVQPRCLPLRRTSDRPRTP